jgi:hypothetical protein
LVNLGKCWLPEDLESQSAQRNRKVRKSTGEKGNPLIKLNLRTLWLLGLFCAATLLAASGLQEKPGAAARPGAEYTGAYTFLREGEFVQITVGQESQLSGFVSRYGDLDSDKGVLLDHFFKNGKFEGNRLSFSTEVVHGVSFRFAGTIGRGSAAKPDEEGYYLIEGKLTEISSDESGKGTSRERGVTLKSFAKKVDGAGSTTPSHK